jgi:Spy/CpxP family protein refolding chaperone
MSPALRWKLIAGFLLVFIAGGMTGAFFGASHMRNAFFHLPRHGMLAEHMRNRLQRELDLTPEQMAKISPIIDKTAAQLERIRQETGQRVHGIISDAHREIATNLNDEQRAKLKNLETRFRHGRDHRRGPGRWRAPDSESTE